MGKSKVNDETNQSHKRHNKQNDKHKRKQKLKKNKKKIKDERSKVKEVKKEKEKLKKLKLASEAFASKVSSEEIHTVKKIIAKLLKHNQDSILELPELFEMLDKGFEVNIKDLQDSYVLAKLNKVFKLLKLKRSKDNKLEFKKIDKIHDFKMKPLIQHFIDEYLEEERNKEGESSDSDNESAYSSYSNTNKKRKHRSRSRSQDALSDRSSSLSQQKEERKDKLTELQEQMNKMQYVKAQQDSSESDDDDIGPQIPDDQGKDFLSSTMDLIKHDDDQIAPSKELESQLNAMFDGAQQRNRDRDRKGTQQVQQESKAKYLGVIDKKLTEEEELLKQKVISEYLEEYNQQFRTKSLYEEFQEKKRDARSKDTRSKDQRLNDQMAKPFDRQKDLRKGGSAQHAQKAFNIINKNNLDKRFQQGNSYM